MSKERDERDRKTLIIGVSVMAVLAVAGYFIVKGFNSFIEMFWH